MIKWKINLRAGLAGYAHGDFNEIKYVFHSYEGKIIRDWIMDAVRIKETYKNPDKLLNESFLKPIINEYFKEND